MGRDEKTLAGRPLGDKGLPGFLRFGCVNVHKCACVHVCGGVCKADRQHILSHGLEPRKPNLTPSPPQRTLCGKGTPTG